MRLREAIAELPNGQTTVYRLARLDGDRLPHPAIDYAVKEFQDTG
jgi:hypothetical protein